MGISLKHLNRAQRQAVKFGDDALLVIAGAGSGKTRVLTYRVAHLLERGYLPSRILVTTFTTKAADEMRERLEGLVGARQADRLRIGTFHSICLRIMKDLSESRGNYEHPRLMMGGGRFMTMLGIVNKYAWRQHNHRFATKDIKGILNKISYWKNEGLRVKDVEKWFKDENLPLYSSDPDKDPYWKFTWEGTMLQAYKDYEAKLKEDHKIDFDDMLLKTYHRLKLKKNKKFLERTRRKLEHILVDEAQDLNKIQFLLVELFAGDNRRITMVGDDYQVLYGFRGARVQEIMHFGEKYKAAVVKLEQNYRSTPEIVGYANKLIKHNKVQMWKDLYTDNPSGVPAHLSIAEDCDDEALNVLEKIQDLIMEGYELNDIAILFRTNAQARAIVDTFIINHVPHKLYSREGFYDRKEVKDMLAYLRIVANPSEAIADDFTRIINRPSRFLGKKIFDDIENVMFDHGYDSFWYALKGAWSHLDLGDRQSASLSKFIDMFERMMKKVETTEMSTRSIFEMIIEETGYLEWMNKKTEEEGEEEPDNDKEMNLDSLLVGAERFNNPNDFLRFVDSQEYEKNEDEDAVHVMTVHKSKGMEFPFVFVIGVSQPVMPHYKADDIEEERRIAYVAVTRAKEELFISAIAGLFNKAGARPSYFIEEMGMVKEGWYDKMCDAMLNRWFSQDIVKKKPPVVAYDTYDSVHGLTKQKKIPVTKYDGKGNLINTIQIDPGTDPEHIANVIDATIGDKNFDRDENGEFEVISATEHGEDDDYARRR